MKYLLKFPAAVILFIVIAFSIVSVKANETINNDGDYSEHPFVQNPGATNTPTITGIPANQLTITPTYEITATHFLEPFPTITLVFPELPDTPTSTGLPPTKEPDKGVPLPMVSSNNPPNGKSGLIYAVVLMWLILVIFAVFIARKAYHLWFE